MVYMEEDRSQNRGFPYSFGEACEFFKVPRIGLVKVERLGQQLLVAAQTVTLTQG